MEDKVGVPYAELRDQMRTLDLILFRGGDFVSNFISKVEKMSDGDGSYSHVGLVIRAQKF